MRRPLKNLRVRAVVLETAIIVGLGVLALSLPFARFAVASVNTTAQQPADDDLRGKEPQDVVDRAAAIEKDLKRAPNAPWAGDQKRGQSELPIQSTTVRLKAEQDQLVSVVMIISG